MLDDGTTIVPEACPERTERTAPVQWTWHQSGVQVLLN